MMHYRVKKDIWTRPIKYGFAGENDIVHAPFKGRSPSVRKRGRVPRGHRVGPCWYTEDAFEEVEDDLCF